MNLAFKIGQDQMEFLEIIHVFSSHVLMLDCDASDKMEEITCDGSKVIDGAKF